VDGNPLDLVHKKDRPLGVLDLIAFNKTMIRVTYDPKIVGARDLLLDPFFRNAKLGPVAPNSLIASGRTHAHRVLLLTLSSTLLTIPVLILSWAPLPKHEILYGAISLGLATIVQTVIAGPFYVKALKALFFSHMIEMDLLIVLSTSVAFAYSVIAYAYLASGSPLSTGLFFETSTLLVTLIMVGRYISVWARQKAIESICTTSIQNPTALLVDPKSHQELEIDARLLQYQDTFKVLPETPIVTDGVIVTGDTEVDESLITGEAKLVTKQPGMSVTAGSINYSGTIVVALTHLPHENTIQTIGDLVDEAKSSKPPIHEIADRVAAIFVPAILAITIIIFITWVAVGVARQQRRAEDASIIAMTYAISALIVSCPCAIGLAVPMVVAIAGGIAAKHGLILKSSGTIEIARSVSHVVFDKTGTLTEGKLAVVTESYPTNQSDILAPMIAGLAASSKHPVSVAMFAHMEALGVQALQFNNTLNVVGSGIEAIWNGKIVRGGNPYWMGVESLPFVHENLSQGLTMFCVTIDGSLVTAFGLKDSLRHDAVKVIDELKSRSTQISILSGDNEEAVRSTAGLLGIPQSHVRYQCTPSDKQQYVAEMVRGQKNIVMFCGDGTNDAGALAQASIGMHMNGGTDIAQNAADVVLMHPSLSRILVLVDLSKAFHRCVISNFLWSFIYNVVAILLAAGAFPYARISPQFAGLGEVVSVLPVIAIAMLLRLFKKSSI
jgi:Cu2+-exporting ATPase